MKHQVQKNKKLVMKTCVKQRREHWAKLKYIMERAIQNNLVVRNNNQQIIKIIIKKYRFSSRQNCKVYQGFGA